MSGFFSKLFGKGGSKQSSNAVDIVGDTLEGVFERAGFDLSFDVSMSDDDKVIVEVYGADDKLLKERDGQLLDALQFFSKRVLQHHLPESKTDVVFDSNGFREESNQALIELADKLKGIVLEKNKSVYFRALPPKERKIVHQYLAEDARVKSRSIGDGLYKKIKIFPAGSQKKGANSNQQQESSSAGESSDT